MDSDMICGPTYFAKEQIDKKLLSNQIKSNFIMKCDKRTQNIESSVRMTVQKKT